MNLPEDDKFISLCKCHRLSWFFQLLTNINKWIIIVEKNENKNVNFILSLILLYILSKFYHLSNDFYLNLKWAVHHFPINKVIISINKVNVVETKFDMESLWTNFNLNVIAIYISNTS